MEVLNIARGRPKSIILKFQKQRIRALIDTGAEVSIISDRVFHNLQRHSKLQTNVNLELQCANGNPLQVLGVASLDFKIGNKIFKHHFYVVKNLSRNCLLGNDFLEKNDVIINMKLRKLKIGDLYVTLEDDIHISTVVRSSRNVELRPHTSHVCEVRVKNVPYFEKSDFYEIIPPSKGYLSEEPGVVVESSLIQFKNGKFPVLISNKTDKTIKIRRGCVVGTIDKDVCKINSVKIQEKTFPKIDPIKEEEVCVPEKYREQIVDLLHRNEQVNANSDLTLKPTDTVHMTIDVGGAEPIKKRPYRTPLNNRQIIDKAVDDMLEAGIIERSQSSWSFPVVIVDKADGTKRFCVDFRELNKVTKTMAYPLPLIDEILAQLGQSKFFTCLDLRSGYHQVKMAEKDKDKTAFTCHRGLFQFTVMPFGLTNAPAIFMLLMQTVLQGMENFSIAYLDDIIIFSKSEEEHLEHIQRVFDRLIQHSLKIKLKKCSFFQQSTNYLGFIITPEGVKPNPEKVEAIRKMAPPTTVKEVRGFIGLTSYYRRFIPNFSKIAEPILDLTKKFARFKWSPECQKAFDFIKESLSVVPLLAYPDTSKPYTLYTDASDTCIGSCLTQIDDSGIEKPIYFLSHRLSRTQTRWPVVEKEAYAIHYSLQKLDCYLHNAVFTIKTDHMPLKYLLESPMQNKKLQLWALSLASYNCKVVYLKGSDNVMADLLSRLPNDSHSDANDPVLDINDNAFEVNAINSNKFDPKQFATCNPKSGEQEIVDLEGFDVKTEQEKDSKISHIIEALKENDEKLKKRHMLLDGVLYFVSNPNDEPLLRLYVPSHLTTNVLKQFHDDNGHMGVEKTYSTIGRKYYWPLMFQEAYDYVSACVTCQERVLRARKAPLQCPELPPYPFAKVFMDISGPYPRTLSGNRFILSIVCGFSGWPEVWALPDKCADTIAHILVEEFFPRFSCPLQLVTDNGSENVNSVLRETLKSLNIDHVTTSFYHPEGNSKVERFHRTLHDVLSKKLDRDLTTWDLHLNQTVAAVRFSVNETTKFSPFFLVYNRDPILPLDNILKPRPRYNGDESHKIALENQHFAFLTVHKRLRRKQEKNKRLADKNRQDINFEVGDPVYLKNHQRKGKLDRKWTPYYRIIEKLSPLTYKIRNQLDSTVTKAHVQNLRKAPIFADWQIPAGDDDGSRRRATYVVNPSASDADSEDSENSDLPQVDVSRDQNSRQRMLKRFRHERSNSSAEEDIPLLEHRRRLRSRQAMLAREKVSMQLRDIEKRLAKKGGHKSTRPAKKSVSKPRSKKPLLANNTEWSKVSDADDNDSDDNKDDNVNADIDNQSDDDDDDDDQMDVS